MRIFIGCEESDTVGAAFREQGHEVLTGDLLASRVGGASLYG
jgi:hypothetical protein